MKFEKQSVSPFVDLGPDVFGAILSHIAGEPLSEAITTTAYRMILPFAITCKGHYTLTTKAICGLSLLPLNFTSEKYPCRVILPFPSSLQVVPEGQNLSLQKGADHTTTSVVSALGIRSTQTRAFKLRSVEDLSKHLPRAVASLPSLRKLSLYRNSEVDDSGLSNIAQSRPQLQELRLRACSTVTSSGLDVLIKFPHLRVLDLSFGRNFGDDCAPLLCSLPCLKTLLVSYWPITDAFVETICKSKSIRELGISACALLTKKSCQSIAAGNRIQKLHFQSSRTITDTAITALTKSTSIQTLVMAFTAQLSDVSLIAMSSMISLETLNVANCPLLTDNGLCCLTRLPNLRSINLSYCELLTDQALFTIANVPSVEEVTMICCIGISDDGVASLTTLPNLRILRVNKCASLGDRTASAIRNAANAPLHLVDVRQCSSITKQALSSLKRACKELLASYSEAT